MEILAAAKDITTVAGGLIIVLIGGIATFIVIKYQVTKDLQNTISIYKEELEAMKVKIVNLQEQITSSQTQINTLTTERDGLKFKKDYLKNIIIQALANKVSVDQTLSKELNALLKSK